MAESKRFNIYYPDSKMVGKDKIVISHLSFNSTPGNTAERLKILANLLGLPVIGIVRRGTNTTHFDRSLRVALGSPERLIELCRDDATELTQAFPDILEYPMRLLEGSSGGAASALGMALAADGLATHLLVREAYDHLAPESQIHGAYRIVRGMIGDLFSGDKTLPITDAISKGAKKRPTALHQIQYGIHAMRTGYVEMRHWGICACGDFTSVAAETIAREHSHLPMLSIEYEHGLGGDVEKSRRFAERLEHLRRPTKGATLIARVESGRHNAPLNPHVMQAQIEETFSLTS